jgi:hypothetical protein
MAALEDLLVEILDFVVHEKGDVIQAVARAATERSAGVAGVL